MTSGVGACAKSLAEASAVTSSLVRNEIIQETSTLYGLPLQWATMVTAGVCQFLYSSRSVAMMVWMSAGFIAKNSNLKPERTAIAVLLFYPGALEYTP